MKEGIGMVRFLMGLGMAGFGMLGIWDGVRDLIRPEKKVEMPPGSQFILTDTSGNRSSLITPEVLREQMNIMAESAASFCWRIWSVKADFMFLSRQYHSGGIF